MIDAADCYTRQLDLGEARPLGRPPTGRALSGAERQRAYLKRLQSSRDGNSQLVEDLRAQICTLLQALDELRDEHAQLIARTANVAARPENGGLWRMQYKVKGSRRWTTSRSTDGFTCQDEAFAHLLGLAARAALGGDKSSQWRAIRDDGVVYDPRDCR